MKTMSIYSGALALVLVLGLASGCITRTPRDELVKIDWVCDDTGANPNIPCEVDVTGTDGLITDVRVEDIALIDSLTVNDFIRQTDIWGSLDSIDVSSGTLAIHHNELDPIVSDITTSGDTQAKLDTVKFEALTALGNSSICMADGSQGNGPISLGDNATFIMNYGLLPMEGEVDPVQVTLTGSSEALILGRRFSLVDAGLTGCTWDVEPDGVAHTGSKVFTATDGNCQISGVSKGGNPLSFVVTIDPGAILQVKSGPYTVNNCLVY